MNRRTRFIGVCLICAANLGGPELRAQPLDLPSVWRPMQWFNTDTTPHPAVVRVFAPEPDGVSCGSGTLVATTQRYGLVVTNWHVVRDAQGEVSVAFPDGFRSGATVLKVDQDWDLAALLIWRPAATPIPIASTPPRPGDGLTIAGYGQGNYRSVTARCTQYVSPGDNFPYEMVEVSAQARDGDSGGPILNDRGELAGVLFGAGRGTTSGSQSGRVRLFLADVWPPPPHESQTNADVASAPTLGDPEPFDRHSRSMDQPPEPFLAEKQQRPHSPSSALQSQPFSRHREQKEQPDPRQGRDQHADSADRLVRTDNTVDPFWSRAEVPTQLPRFARSSSEDARIATQPDEKASVRTAETSAAKPVPTTIDWHWILGDTALEKFKTVLAAIGLFALVVQLAKWSDRGEEGEEASE